VSRNRVKASIFVLVALAAAAVPAGASAFMFGPITPAPAPTAAAPVARTLREQLRSTGVYDVSVTVATAESPGRFVDVELGPLARRAQVDAQSHSARLQLTLAINRLAFTVRVTPALARAHVSVLLRRIGAVANGTAPQSIAVAAAPASAGKTRASGVVSKPAKATSSAAGATGPTGASGAGGTTGSTGSTPPATPPAAPAAPVASFGPNGNPIIGLPSGFAPIVNYSNPVKDYEFDGSSLPTDWSAGMWSYGFSSTLFQPSQVSLTGSSAALTAIDQASGGYPYQSGWISTEGSFSMTHGMVDFRAKMPGGQGLWSALWLDQPNGSNPWGEIDAQEMLLGNTHIVYGSLHNWAPNPYWGEWQATTMADDATQGFHDYQVVWQPGLITWAVDGIAYAQYSETEATANGQFWPFDDGTGFYLIADLAVGGSSDWGGAPDASTAFPATMQVQSVKVWE
jgi:hypothetical protein